MKTVCFAVVFACLIGVGTCPAVVQFQNVGSIDFPTSETGQAQQHFLRGVAILHSFGWNQAIEQLRAAHDLSPDFALAYWGESLSYNHPLNSQMDPGEPRRVLERLGAKRSSSDGPREGIPAACRGPLGRGRPRGATRRTHGGDA